MPARTEEKAGAYHADVGGAEAGGEGVTENRSRLHHLALQQNKCARCQCGLTYETSVLHHLFTRHYGMKRPKKGVKVALCVPCHKFVHKKKKPFTWYYPVEAIR